MKKYGIIVLLLLCNFWGITQEYFKEGNFVLKGKIKNPAQPFFEFNLTNYLGFFTHSVPLRNDGSFEKSFPVQHRQQLTLLIGTDDIHFLVEQGDTLTLGWDDTQVHNTFSVRAPAVLRNNDLQLEYKLDTSLRIQSEQLQEYLAINKVKGNPKDNYAKINDVFNQHLHATLGQGPYTRHQINLVTGLYYQYTNLLSRYQLLGQYKLQPQVDSAWQWSIDVAKPGFNLNKLNEFWFQDIPQYREFIYNYVQGFALFEKYNSLKGTPIKKFNPVLNQYHRVQSAIDLLPIRDWFLTKTLIEGFQNYVFQDVAEVYQKVMTEIGTPYLKDTLEHYYAAVSRLKPGNPAPAFTLKDTKGKMVRLSDFRGKVVYMNWWGVHCGPCLYEIQNFEAVLHQQYKGRDIVFVNICVGAGDAAWKAALKKYKLEGINLTAPGWTDDPACQAYNIDGVPHYVIIDEKGAIVNNNAPRPSELKRQGQNNELDRALLKKAL